MTTRRTALPALAALLLLAGCTSGGDAPVTLPPTSAPASPPAPPSPSPSPSPSPLASRSPTSAPASRIVAPPAEHLARTDEFGYLRVVQGTTQLTVDVDRVDMLSGEAAAAAARAAGTEYSDDYFLVNANPRLRRYRVAPDAVVWASIRMGGPVEGRRVTPGALRDHLATPEGPTTLFHLQVRDGVVVGVEEQYLP